MVNDLPESGLTREAHRMEAAFRAAGLLVEAYRRGEECGSVSWEDVDLAFEAALEALPER